MNLTKNQKILGVGAIITIILLAIFIPNILGLSVISVSQGVPFYDGTVGKVVSLITISVNSPIMTTYSFIPQNYTLQNGTIVSPIRSIDLILTPSIAKCSYQLTPHEEKLGGISIYTWYELNQYTRERSVYIRSSASTDSITFNGFDTQKEQTLVDADGKGAVTISAQGGSIGNQDCLASNDYIAFNNGGVPKVVSRSNYEQVLLQGIGTKCTNLLLIGECYDLINGILAGNAAGAQTPAAWANFYDSYVFSNDLTTIKAKPINQQIFMPIVTIAADEDYFNSVRISPAAELVQPVLVSFSTNKVEENSQGSYVLKVRNPSNYDKQFSGSISSNVGTISPLLFELDVPPNSEATQTFIYTAPEVSTDTNVRFSIEVCDTFQIGSKCASNIYTRSIEDTPDTALPEPPDPEVCKCGDNRCDALCGETYYNCAQDCDVPPPTTPDCNEIQNSYLKNGQCVCNDGFARIYDSQTGAMQCTKPMDYTVIAIAVAAVLAFVFVAFGMKKGGRKR